VSVGGSLYDVSFQDGTCVALFNGCNEQSDFLFSNQTAAYLASQALLDQVFIGSYDTQPELTFGCTINIVCSAATPYFADASTAYHYASINYSGEGDTTGNRSQPRTDDLSFQSDKTYALWTVAAVPEPSTWLMMILGLGIVGHSLRRNNARQHPLALAGT
jgi:hypothetical protein